MSYAQAIVRIADKFLSPRNSTSIPRTGNLSLPLLCVTIAYTCVGTYAYNHRAFLEREHRILSDITFEFIVAPPPPKPVVVTPPQSQPVIPPIVPVVLARTTQIAGPKSANPVPTENTAKLTGPTAASVAPPPATKTAAPAPKDALPGSKEIPDTSPPQVKSEGEGKTSAGQESQGPGNEQAGGGGTGQNAGGGQEGESTDGKGEGQKVAMLPRGTGATTSMGNIGPYRREMLMRIAQNWHPKKQKGNIVLVISLSPVGELLDTKILESSGDDKLDSYAVETVGKTEFAPLPDWFKGHQLRFKIELARLEALRSDRNN